MSFQRGHSSSAVHQEAIHQERASRMDDDNDAEEAVEAGALSSVPLLEAEAEADSFEGRRREAASSAQYLSEAAIREFEAQYTAAAVAGVVTEENDERPTGLSEPTNEARNTHSSSRIRHRTRHPGNNTNTEHDNNDNRRTLTTTTTVTNNTQGRNTTTTLADTDGNDAEPDRAAEVADVEEDSSSNNTNPDHRRRRRRNRHRSTDRMMLQQLLRPELRIPGPLVVLHGNIGDGIANTMDDMNAVNGSNGSGSNSALPQVTTVERTRNDRDDGAFERSEGGEGDQERRREERRPLPCSPLNPENARNNTIPHEEAHSQHGEVSRTTGATVAANARFSILPTTTTTVAGAAAAIPPLVEEDEGEAEPRSRRLVERATTPTAVRSSTSTSTITTRSSSLIAEEDRRSIAAWNQTRRRHELQQRRDFQEALVVHPNQASSSVDQHVMMQQSHHPNRQHHTMTTTTTTPYWWERNGAIAILRELPTKLRDYYPSSSGSTGFGRHATTNDATANLRNGDTVGGGGAVYVPSSIGTLQPGTVVQALDLIELHATTLVPISNNNNNKDTTTTSTKRERRPKRQQQQQQSNTLNSPQRNKKNNYGRKGVIQMIKLETHEGRIGYACINLEGYPLLIPPDGTNTHTTTNTIAPKAAYNMELSGAASSAGWRWRVTCPSGAYVRQGLDLHTQHLCTLPYGTLLQVTKRCINNQGLSRLQTTAIVPVVPAAGVDHQDRQYKIIQGWCSELLNPLSGQRGIIAQPIAFPVPALYRVTLPIGAVIRRDIELSSPQIGTATFGSIVKICRRAYSEHPVDQCIERLKLVGNGGWISIRLNRPHPNDDLIVEFVDIDPDFDPEASGLYHIHEQRKVLLQQQQDRRQRRRQHAVSGRRAAAAAAALSSNNDITDLSSVDENDDDTDDDTDDDNDDGMDDTDLLLLNASTDLLSRSSRAITTNGSNNDSNVPHKPQLCVVCLTSERNATIVHGETGHVVCCLVCARILKARGDRCPVCRLNIDVVIQHFYA